jgi:WD40 repeat protein
MDRDSALSASEAFPPHSLPALVRVLGEAHFHTDGDVLALAFGADGGLCSVEEPGILRRWDTNSGRAISTASLSDLEMVWQFSDDARLVASASDEVSLWEVATGHLIKALPQPAWVTALALCPNPVMVAIGHDDGTVRLCEATSGREIRELKGHDLPVGALAFSPDGRRLASAGEDRVIRIWDVASGRTLGILAGHTDHIQQIVWHPEGTILVSAGWDRTARVWNTNTFEPVILLNTHADQLTATAFSADGKMLACADSANAIRLWDSAVWRELGVMTAHEDEIRALAFSPDGNHLASAGVDRVIRLWNPRRRQPEGRFDAEGGRSGLAIVADPHTAGCLASASNSAGLKIWEIDSGKVVLDRPGQFRILAASPDGRWLASDAEEGVQLWDAHAFAPARKLSGQRGRVAALAFAPDCRTLASASRDDGTVWLWDVASGEPALVIPVAADGSSVEALAFHPGGTILASGGIDHLSTGGSDGAIGLWDTLKRQPLGVLNRGATDMAFHPAGRWLATTGLDHCVRVWDIENQRPVFEIRGHSDRVRGVAYHPGGQWLVSGGDDRTLRVWNAQDGDSIAVHEIDTAIHALAFSADGRFLYTSNGNTTCYQLDSGLLQEETPELPLSPRPT